MNRILILLLMSLAGCRQIVEESATPVKADIEQNAAKDVQSEEKLNDCINSIVLNNNSNQKEYRVDLEDIFGEISEVNLEKFKAYRGIELNCKTYGYLPYSTDNEINEMVAPKAIISGMSGSNYWGVYLYYADRDRRDGDGLYGYMATLVLFDRYGNPVGSEVVSEIMSYEGFVKIKKATIKNNYLEICDHEAELFEYDENSGDITGELANPKRKPEKCENINFPFKGISKNPAIFGIIGVCKLNCVTAF